MSNDSKQIYVSLELGLNDIRVLVSEYYSTRFNIIRNESYPSDAISDFKIVDRKALVNNITYAIKDTSAKIGAQIEKVILVLPAYNFKRFTLRSSIIPENGVVRKDDIIRAVSNSLKAKIDDGVMVVNPVVTKYTVNGISTRRMPEKEISDDVVADIDLLCCDKQMAYDYVSVVEEAGIKVLDITLNSYCIAKESSLIEESLKKNIIILDIEKEVTYLSLLSKGKLISCETIFEGLAKIARPVKSIYELSDNDLYKLVKFNVDYDSKYPDDTVYAISRDSKTSVITTKKLNDLVKDSLNDYAENIITMCKPIMENGADLIVTGEGEQMKALVNILKEKNNGNCRLYYPDTIGVRDPSLTALYGSFIVYREKAVMNNLSVNCINLLEYDTSVKDKDFDADGDTITSKIKSLFKQYVKGDQ
ncbi:MAG: hypothetical protein Q4D13_01440 [Erysipelotrichaceae bacterium]|nr:hypothetical protein [Erysipelotrichaceae bacterium]